MLSCLAGLELTQISLFVALFEPRCNIPDLLTSKAKSWLYLRLRYVDGLTDHETTAQDE